MAQTSVYSGNGLALKRTRFKTRPCTPPQQTTPVTLEQLAPLLPCIADLEGTQNDSTKWDQLLISRVCSYDKLAKSGIMEWYGGMGRSACDFTSIKEE